MWVKNEPKFDSFHLIKFFLKFAAHFRFLQEVFYTPGIKRIIGNIYERRSGALLKNQVDSKRSTCTLFPKVNERTIDKASIQPPPI